MSLKKIITGVALVIGVEACSTANNLSNLSQSASLYNPTNNPVTCTYKANSQKCEKRTERYTLYAIRENDICETGIFITKLSPSAPYLNNYEDYLKLKDVFCDGRVDTVTEGRKISNEDLVWPTAYKYTKLRSENLELFKKEADSLSKKINDEVMEHAK